MKIIHRVSIFMLIFIYTALGCAKPYVRPTPTKEDKPQYGTVGIIHAKFLPEVMLQHYAVGTSSGALKGAGEGALAPIKFFSQGMAGGPNPVAGLFVAIGIALAPVGAIAGSISGAIKAVPEEEARHSQEVMRKAVASLKAQEKLVEQVAYNCIRLSDYNFKLLGDEGPIAPDKTADYTSLKTKGIQTVLEVSVINIGFLGGVGKDPSIALFMDVSARLIRTENSQEIRSILQPNKYFHQYVSMPRKIHEWAKDNSRPLVEELENCYKTLGEQISDTAFLTVPSQAMLETLDPKVKWEARSGSSRSEYVTVTRKRIMSPQVGSLRPKIVWEPFPGNTVSNVTYDLKIWKAEDDFPVKLVYFRQGLTESSQTLEDSLEPASKYYWTVRARFKYDGYSGATAWQYPTHPSPFKVEVGDGVISYGLYDFVTPP
jgi:hypothetical protein